MRVVGYGKGVQVIDLGLSMALLPGIEISESNDSRIDQRLLKRFALFKNKGE